ncbi:MAG TPA: DUF4446 family protein [Clostridiales bacterium]|nr:DUF4446 family protein [Clostridiales bacterium]
MDTILTFLEQYQIFILLIAILVGLISIILLIVNMVRTSIIIKRYKKLMRGMNNKNLEAVINENFDNIEKSMARVDELEAQCNYIENQLKQCFQKIGIVRYNPFKEMGSDLSFSIALLDDRNNGLILTSLYGRDTASTFAKPIRNLKSDYALTMEEKKALQMALERKFETRSFDE